MTLIRFVCTNCNPLLRRSRLPSISAASPARCKQLSTNIDTSERPSRRNPSMPLKFAANLSTMFRDVCPNLADRYKAARDVGFRAVECQFPYSECSADQLAKVRQENDLLQVLINSYPGDLQAGELGFASNPAKEKEFKESVDLSIEYAKALKCDKIHVMGGKLTSADHKIAEDTYIKNLSYAAKQLKKEGILAIIEPINTISVPNYFMCSFEKAVEYIKLIDDSNLKLLLDVFHLQMIRGNLTHSIKELMPYVGHVQISQAPHRGHPNSAGEIDYRYVLNLLEDVEYDGWIGLEYFPKDCSTLESLSWIEEYGYKI